MKSRFLVPATLAAAYSHMSGTFGTVDDSLSAPVLDFVLRHSGEK